MTAVIHKFEPTTEQGKLLIDAIRKVAEELPNQITGMGKCWYVDNETQRPSCLIGRALWNIGRITADYQESQYNGQGFFQGVNLDLGFDELTAPEELWIRTAQDTQDSQETFAMAVESADRTTSPWKGNNNV